MNWELKKHKILSPLKGPLVIAVLDGVGIGNKDRGDAVYNARMPAFDALKKTGLGAELFAHGQYVGLPSNNDMGNSEVGHNALGCGVVHKQGALLVNQAIESGDLYQGDTWKHMMSQLGEGNTLHFLGLLSDGNVHSHIKHFVAMCEQAKKDGVKSIALHALLDGRDVGAKTAEKYIEQVEKLFKELKEHGVDARFASGGGRMVTTMDRYNADWTIVKRGWDAHVRGDARHFRSAMDALTTLRNEDKDATDQTLPAFVIVDDNGKPKAPIRDGDAVINFNFRGDRAIQISRAFEENDFNDFERRDRPKIMYAGMMEYDGDLKIPKNYLVNPPKIDQTMGEFLARNKKFQLALSETQKFGHVTYFWNGNKSGFFDETSETYIEVPSDRISFEKKPEMKAKEITDSLIQACQKRHYDFVRLNYANGDMVGHTGDFGATVSALEHVDHELARLKQWVDAQEGVLVITADHGNADDMIMKNKDGSFAKSSSGTDVPKTSHSLNKVPFVVYDSRGRGQYTLNHEDSNGIANISATCIELMGLIPPLDMRPSLLRFK